MRNKKGFTLIELLVVIAIIGLLSTLAVVSLNGARTKARDSKRVADIRSIQSALEMGLSDNSTYYVLTTAEGVIPDGGLPSLNPTPDAPTPADGTCTTANNLYTYNSTTAAGAACTSGPCASYELQFCLGAATGGMAAGLHCASPAGITDAACTLTD